MNSTVKSNQLIKEFKHDLSGLSVNERQVLEKLIKAARLIAPIYQKQQDPKYPGANFYPHDVEKTEIENAAKKDPSLLDPYTIVKRKNGKLISVPYHLEYRQYLLPIAKQLLEAAKITINREFGKRLELQADALLDGTYDVADIYWLSMRPYKIDIVIGPIERYDDRLFFTKCAYQAWVGVMDEVETRKAKIIKEAVFSSSRKIITPVQQAAAFDRVQLRIDKEAIFSGLIAKFMFSSASLPNDVETISKYGSEITIFENSLNSHFVSRHHPIFHAVFEKKFQQSFPIEHMQEAALLSSLVHELGRQYLQYRGAEERLRDVFPVIAEIGSAVIGIKLLGPLLLKGIITQKQLESVLVIFFCRAFDWWDKYKSDPGAASYVRGNAIALNFLLSSGALQQQGGISWPNFTKMFVALSDLAEILEKILSVGGYQDAKDFIDNYGSFGTFDLFRPKLSQVLKDSS